MLLARIKNVYRVLTNKSSGWYSMCNRLHIVRKGD